MNSKTGADAVYKSIKLICNTLGRYSNKLHAFIDAAVAANVITAGQGTTAHAFIDSAGVACDIFQLLARYNSLQP